ncbi:glycosyltransferase [Streptomyces sp. NPDC087440]|uniref:glycosyltransferase n=1 Tax=Streptomyces sp. NPDC087440 TaxID=3365790 RepID=UPI00382F5ADC
MDESAVGEAFGGRRTRLPHGRALVLHDYLGHPFQLDLSRELARRGAAVLHLYREDHVGTRGDTGAAGVEGLTVRAVRAERAERAVQAVRAERAVRGVRGVRAAPAGGAARAVRPTGPRPGPRTDVDRYLAGLEQALPPTPTSTPTPPAPAPAPRTTFLCGNAHPAVQWGALRLARARGWRCVYWLQDVHSALPGADPHTTALEARALRASDHVVAVTPGFADAARELGVPDDRLTLVPNWAPLDLPGARAPWPPAQKLGGGPLFVYAGALDDRHAPELLAELAAACTRRRTGRLLVVSQGSGRDLLADRRRTRGLDRLELLDFRPYEEVPAMFAAADVLVVTLAADAAAVSAPSKVLAYLAAGRCVLAAAPPDSETARVVAASGGGVVTAPDDPAAFAARGMELLADAARRARCGAAARAWAGRTFALAPIADRFGPVLWP